MVTQNVEPDKNWVLLADEEEEERRAKMVQRYTELAILPEEERTSQMMEMAMAEYSLADAKLRSLTLSRLSVWLSLDTEMAQKLASSYDAAMLKLPGQHAMRRVALVQTLARDFSPEQQVQLVTLLPDVFGGLKEALLASQRLRAATETENAAPTTQVKKSWWPFGKR